MGHMTHFIVNGLALVTKIMSQKSTKHIAQIIIVICIICVVSSMLFIYFERARAMAKDAKKKTEMSQMFTLMQFYYVGENKSPINPRGQEWCVINDHYDGKKCMQEIVRDGYIEAIVQSPDARPYLYHSDDQKFLIASQMSRPLKLQDQCEFSDDPRVWCKVFYKE